MASRHGFLEEARELAFMNGLCHLGIFIWASRCPAIKIAVKPC